MMPIAWPTELLPEGALLGFAMAIAASLLGAWMGARLASDRLPRERPLRLAAVGAAAVVAGLVLFGLQKPADEGVRGTISIAESGAASDREGVVTVALDPPDAAEGAEWFQAISWQGGGLVLEDMRPTGEPGTYETSRPVPLHGDWKTLVRLHKGNSLTGLPVYLPVDEAIPVDEVPATKRRDARVHRRPRDPAARAAHCRARPVGGRVRRGAGDHGLVPGADRLGPPPPRGHRRGAASAGASDGEAHSARPESASRSEPPDERSRAAAGGPRRRGQLPAVRRAHVPAPRRPAGHRAP